MVARKITEHVYLVGCPDLAHELDCNVYLVDGTPYELVLIDSGCGLGVKKILENIENWGFYPERSDTP